MPLSTTNHDRHIVGLTYVYPVISRRAGGVSLGINLNPNNACNFRCIYCQVPNLVFGKAPAIDILVLKKELHQMLEEIVQGNFLERNVPEASRRFNDIALSGNGEPTGSLQFSQVIDLVAEEMAFFNLIDSIKVVLITNGTFVNRPKVREGIRKLSALNGEVWFKLDSATINGTRRINSIPISTRRNLLRLKQTSEICSTFIQTCLFALDGKPPSENEQQAYLNLLDTIVAEGIPVKGVHLYTLARPSCQPEAKHISALPSQWLCSFAQRAEAAGIPIYVAD